jgi:threonine aldolase
MLRSFASDNNSGVHPDVMNALISANTNHAVGYGDDVYTHKAKHLFNELFGAPVDVYFVFNGTGANITSIQSVCRSFEAVIASDVSHINVDECGSPEKMFGGKLLTIPNINGKINASDIEPFLHAVGNEHHAQPRLVSITQVSELGTVYSLSEIGAICQFAHQNNLFVHMDGARIANAAAALNCSIKELTTDLGVDVVSFGGTKNGLMFGEAVVFINEKLSVHTKYIRKQSAQLHSKMRFISAQYIAYIENDLWLTNAQYANKMARLLADKLKSITQVKISRPVDSNAVFAIIPKEMVVPLQDKYFFYVWNHQNNEVRWMTSFDTTLEDIDGFVATIKSIL